MDRFKSQLVNAKQMITDQLLKFKDAVIQDP